MHRSNEPRPLSVSRASPVSAMERGLSKQVLPRQETDWSGAPVAITRSSYVDPWNDPDDALNNFINNLGATDHGQPTDLNDSDLFGLFYNFTLLIGTIAHRKERTATNLKVAREQYEQAQADAASDGWVARYFHPPPASPPPPDAPTASIAHTVSEGSLATLAGFAGLLGFVVLYLVFIWRRGKRRNVQLAREKERANLDRAMLEHRVEAGHRLSGAAPSEGISMPERAPSMDLLSSCQADSSRAAVSQDELDRLEEMVGQVESIDELVERLAEALVDDLSGITQVAPSARGRSPLATYAPSCGASSDTSSCCGEIARIHLSAHNGLVAPRAAAAATCQPAAVRLFSRLSSGSSVDVTPRAAAAVARPVAHRPGAVRLISRLSSGSTSSDDGQPVVRVSRGLSARIPVGL